jgi:two-component system sensor histidine kinase SenX3
MQRKFGRKKSKLSVDAENQSAQDELSLVQMRTAMNALPMGVVIVSSDGSSSWVNSAVDEMFVAGSADQQRFMERTMELLHRAIEGGSGKALLEFGDPSVQTLEIETVSLVDGGAAAIVADISSRLVIDRVRTDFVANISHELRTPIGAISLMAENLMLELAGSESARLAEIILNEVTRLNNTVSDLLELAKIEFDGLAKRERVEVSKVIDEAMGRLRSAALSRSVMLVVKGHPDIAIAGDRAQLVSALGNLIDNAVKFSERGSIVKIDSRLEDANVLISVSDNGPGIAAEHQARVFERFYRVDDARSRETGGSGLGLAIVRHIALLHGGEVSIQSAPGEGSTFTLQVPSV